MGNAGSKERNGVPLDRKDIGEVLINPGTTQSRLAVTTSQRLNYLQGKQDKLAKKVARLFQRDLAVRESQSNGVIERAVGLVAGQARTLKARIGTRVFGWWNFAAYLMNRCDIGSDGKTPLQRLHGRRDNIPVLELGEKILYRLAKPARGRKWEPRFILECLWGC